MEAIREIFDPNNTKNLLCHRVNEPYFSTPYHYHPEIELLYVEQGHGTFYVGEAFTEFGPGTLALIGSGVPHWWCSHRDFYRPEGTEHCVATYVQIKPALLSFPGDDSPEITSLHHLLLQAARGLVFSQATAVAVGQQLPTLMRAGGLERIGILLRLLSQLIEADCLPISKHTSVKGGNQDSDRLGLVYALVARRFHENIQLAEVAKATGLSTTSFSRFFRRRTGQTFTTFLNGYRINQACELLRQKGEESISNVAFRVGYNNLSHFNRQFLRVHRIAPREYRKKYRGFMN